MATFMFGQCFKRLANQGWVATEDDSFFDQQGYGLMGWLADIRNYHDTPPLKGVIAGSQKGIPKSIIRCYDDDGSGRYVEIYERVHSVTTDILFNFDYDQTFTDTREEIETTYRKFLGDEYFERLELLRTQGVEVLVFWFD